MPLSGLSINNPQEQNPIASTPVSLGTGAITFGGNVLGSGSTATSGSPSFSNILFYGALALGAIWIFQRLEK